MYLALGDWARGRGRGRRARITKSQKCRQRHLRDIIAEDAARPTCPSPAVGDCPEVLPTDARTAEPTGNPHLLPPASPHSHFSTERRGRSQMLVMLVKAFLLVP